MFIDPPGALADTFARQSPRIFSFMFCKFTFYVNMSSFFLSELMIVTISFHRALTVFFPMRMIHLSSAYPRMFPIIFGVFVGIAIVLPGINLIYNQVINVPETLNIVDKYNLSEYCFVDFIPGNSCVAN